MLSNRVKIYDTRIELYNPGSLPDSISVGDLLSNNYKSVPRNKLIADYFKSIGLIEKYGSGIRRIIEGCKKEGLPQPDFRNISEGFMVTFYSKDYFNKGTIRGGQTGGQTGGQRGEPVHLTKPHKRILDIMNENGNITRKELSLQLNINESAIQKHITKLKKLGVIKRVGHDFGGYWQVLNQPTKH